MRKDIVVVAIYAHPEGYPPTLNCVNELSAIFDKVVLLGRNVLRANWVYPANCVVDYSSDYYDVRSAERAPLIKKIKFFGQFVWLLFSAIRTNKPGMVLIYDPTALFAYYLIGRIIRRPQVLWYHNHDIFESTRVRKYSIQWWAGKYERKIFKMLDIFSLPADERRKHYDMKSLKGRYFLLPNFPSRGFFGSFYKPKRIDNTIKLIYQGAIAEGHGIEEILGMLNEKIEGKKLELLLIGVISDDYRKLLESVAKQFECESQLRIAPYSPYRLLPEITAEAHIGIAIYSLQTDFHLSLGKASNKIYEYASVGLPILVYDNAHYREHMGTYPWVKFTDLSKKSLVGSITSIVRDYGPLSGKAHGDFDSHLNFETQFDKVKTYLRELPMQSTKQ